MHIPPPGTRCHPGTGTALPHLPALPPPQWGSPRCPPKPHSRPGVVPGDALRVGRALWTDGGGLSSVPAACCQPPGGSWHPPGDLPSSPLPSEHWDRSGEEGTRTLMTWDSSTSTRGSAGLVGGRTVTVSTLEVTARGALRGGGSGCHRDGGGHSMGTAGRPHSPGRGQDEPQRAVQHGPDDEVGRLVQLCRERGREGSGAETAPAHARGARVAQVHPASKHRHGQAHGAAPGMGARPRAPPARVLAPGAAEPRAGRTPPMRSHSHTHPSRCASHKPAPTHTQSLTLTHTHPHPHTTSLRCTLTRVCTAPGMHTQALTHVALGACAT